MAKSSVDKEAPKTQVGYWSALCKNLRQSLNLTQGQMAERLGTDQASISRWERGLTEPQYDMRRVIQGLAQGQGLATLDDIVTAVRLSPFPMMLVDHKKRVIAASSSSGFTPGLSALDQTPANERDNLLRFDALLKAEGFWDRRCNHLEYVTEINGVPRRAAIVTAIILRGQVYALVQKAW